MKNLFTALAVIISVTGSAFSGPAEKVTFQSKKSVDLRPVYGTGWYGALQAGLNVSQDLPKPRGLIIPDFPFPVASTTPNSSIGGFGGGKVGYVFGSGIVRPALEADLFYSGFGFNYDIRDVALPADPYDAVGGSVDSFAYIANLMVRIDCGRFQPYVGAGIGGYTADHNVDSFGSAAPLELRGSRSNSDLAWQIIAGLDYYFTETVSFFTEYKCLNYENFEYSAVAGTSIKNTLRQHLVGIGVRLHF